MSPHDVGAIAADMLKKRLPGFESRIDGSRNTLAIRGALPIGAAVNAQTMLFSIHRPAYTDPIALRDATETDEMRRLREAEERAAIEQEIATAVDHIAEHVQRYGIAALGLEAVIAEREKRARQRGYREGYEDGRDAGRAEGRRELLAELEDARREREPGDEGAQR